MFGSHLFKSWACNQQVVALSSGEAEYYAMVKAASQSLGIKQNFVEFGINPEEIQIEIKTDASAALGIASRLGSGKIRHIETSSLWLQEKVYNGQITITKVDTKENLADALTKPISEDEMKKHVQLCNAFSDKTRHPLAPKIEHK